MVMLVWWIISLFNICEFTWLPVFIDLCLASLFLITRTSDDYKSNVTGLFTMGGAIFAFCKYFLSLSISNWWVLLSPFWFLVAALIPGGFTITDLLLSNNGLMELPIWTLIVGIIVDVLFLIIMIVSLISARKE